MTIYELAALTAATLWAFGGMVSSTPARMLGAIGYGHIRMLMVTAMLVGYVLIMGSWRSVPIEHYGTIIISSVIGIFLGDTALYLTLNRLGPRRTAILFSLNAPISAVLAWVYLDENLSSSQIMGIAIVSLGVMLAVVFGKRKSQMHQWESIKGPLWVGVALGFMAALCQSIGSLLVRPILEAGVDPVATSAFRVAIAALCLTIIVQFPIKAVKRLNPLTPKLLSITALSAFLGIGVGMTLFLFALVGGEIGIVSTLSATSPAILLPLLWIKTKEVPAAGAWLGAALVVAGSVLLFN